MDDPRGLAVMRIFAARATAGNRETADRVKVEISACGDPVWAGLADSFDLNRLN